MRYAAIFVDSVSQWAVMDSLSGGFVPAFFETEQEAREAAELEESRWDDLMADALPRRYSTSSPVSDGHHSTYRQFSTKLYVSATEE